MTIHYYVIIVNILLVYHNLPFNNVLCGKCWYEDQAEVTVNSRNSSCIMSVRCKGGLIYSGNFIKPDHCFHQPKKNVRDFCFLLSAHEKGFYVKQCHMWFL